MTSTRECEESTLRPNLCEVTCRRETVGRTPCEVVRQPIDEPPRNIVAISDFGQAMNERSLALATHDCVLAPLESTDVRPFMGQFDAWAGAAAKVSVPLGMPGLGVRASAGTHESGGALDIPAGGGWQWAIGAMEEAWKRRRRNPIVGRDADGDVVHWSDIVDGNIDPSDVVVL